ncbi:MAG: hypothetical protein HKM93_01125 [Desulfobacteraceae bacterium]|nr:hypothetical protein [Desulfobacteraceae bacterium]
MKHQTISIPIEDMGKSTDKGIQVLISSTKKWAWVPNRPEFFLPGRVILPLKLAYRILKKDGTNGQ